LKIKSFHENTKNLIYYSLSPFLALPLLVFSCKGKGSDVKDENLHFESVYFDYRKPIEERVQDLISKMTLEEKVSQLMYSSDSIPRLGIPQYNWWNEALHGVARAGRATVFPQAIGMAATFDDSLLFTVATAISDEARAKYHASIKRDIRMRYGGLTFWTPNINIFRDARWGRGQETYGEDPFLTSKMGVAFVRGMQGDHPTYMKTAACAKHYAVHSGPEKDRHVFDAVSTPKDLYETYLPAFKALVVDANVEAVMCAYNRTNGEPCCGSPFLLQDVLRNDWNFQGHVVSDCWALVDFHDGHKVTNNAVESAALAINSGVNLNCGSVFPNLVEAVRQGLVTEATIDKALEPLIRTRIKLGMFDPDSENPYASISTDVINSDKHRSLAKEVATKSMVLLKNVNNALPLDKNIPYLFITGPNAGSTEVLIGNYYGLSSKMITILEGITGKLNDGSLTQYKHGFLLDRDNINPIDWTTSDAQQADAIVAVVGISGLLEGEEGESIASDTKGDRFDISLPKNQVDFLKRLRKGYDKPLIVVITGGSPMDLREVHELADAVLLAWYPGEEGGNAVGDVLFGDASPAGRLPITFPMSTDQLPAYEDYSMKGRTYRYMEKEPLYPFGFGLSYTTFNYSDLKLSKSSIRKNENQEVEVKITNAGNIASDEVVQLYFTNLNAENQPLYSLKGFSRINLEPGQSTEVKFTLTPEMMASVDEAGKSVLDPGIYKIYVGGSVPSERSVALGAVKPLESSFEIK
jgi:beta-glucosidase